VDRQANKHLNENERAGRPATAVLDAGNGRTKRAVFGSFLPFVHTYTCGTGKRQGAGGKRGPPIKLQGSQPQSIMLNYIVSERGGKI